MATEISCVIFPDAEQWLRKNLPNIAIDQICSIGRLDDLNLDGVTTYTDFDDSADKITKACTMADHVDALRKLCNAIGRTLFVGGLKSPFELIDPGNWDVEVADAYRQLLLYNEVIYG